MAETQFGFKDLRTAAELALAPALPVSVKVGRVNLTAILPIPQTGKLGKVIGKIQKAAELAGDAYSTYKASIETLKENNIWVFYPITNPFTCKAFIISFILNVYTYLASQTCLHILISFIV